MLRVTPSPYQLSFTAYVEPFVDFSRLEYVTLLLCVKRNRGIKVKILIYTTLVILALILQTTLFASWSFLIVVPDLILVLVVLFSLINGPTFGAKFGFFSGLGTDLLVGEMIGLGALTKMIIGITVGLLSKRFYKENYIIPFISVVIATVIDQLLYVLGMLLFGRTISLFVVLKNSFYLLVYNGILTLLLYLRLFYLNERLIAGTS